MLKITVTREKIKSAPKIVGLDKPTFEDIGKVVVASISDNIGNQKQADGSGLKRNAPSTIRRKEIAGRGARSLIDVEHRFIKPNAFSADATNNSVTVEPRTQELKEISKDVQQMGYTGWFGITAKGRALIVALIKRAIHKRFE